MNDVEKVRNRILSKIQTNPEGCWEWLGAKTKGPGRGGGYGRVKVEGKTHRAHRVAYEIFVGPVPSGLLVCHSCDNRACCNPEHLFLGSHQENMSDMVVKGRAIGPRGETQGLSKLTESQVLEIRSSSGLQRELAARFGVSRSLVSMIRNRKVWAHV